MAVFIHVWALGFYVGKMLSAKIVGNMAYYYVIRAEHIRFPTLNSRRHLISTLLTSIKIYYNKTRSSPLLYSFRWLMRELLLRISMYNNSQATHVNHHSHKIVFELQIGSVLAAQVTNGDRKRFPTRVSAASAGCLTNPSAYYYYYYIDVWLSRHRGLWYYTISYYHNSF